MSRNSQVRQKERAETSRVGCVGITQAMEGKVRQRCDHPHAVRNALREGYGAMDQKTGTAQCLRKGARRNASEDGHGVRQTAAGLGRQYSAKQLQPGAGSGGCHGSRSPAISCIASAA